MGLSTPPYTTAIYHCQQAAEKAVKAYLTARDVEFEKTHDLGHLVAQATKYNREFLRWAEAAQLLTPYATAFRYPGLGDEPMPTREEFTEALGLAQSIYDFVLARLP